MHDCGKLETREDTCTGQVNQYKNYRLQGRSQERFGRLAGYPGWDDGKASDKIKVQTGLGLVETVPETDENNSLQLERIPVLAKSTNIKIIDFKADLKNVLVDWLDIQAGTMGRRPTRSKYRQALAWWKPCLKLMKIILFKLNSK